MTRELVGAEEFARMLGVKPKTVLDYRVRSIRRARDGRPDRFPAAVARDGQAPKWDKAEAVAFAALKRPVGHPPGPRRVSHGMVIHGE